MNKECEKHESFEDIDRDRTAEIIDKNQACNSDLDGSSSFEDYQSPERASNVWDQCTRTESRNNATPDDGCNKIESSNEGGAICNHDADNIAAIEVQGSSSISEDEDVSTSLKNKEKDITMEMKTGNNDDCRTEMQPLKPRCHRKVHSLERKRS